MTNIKVCTSRIVHGMNLTARCLIEKKLHSFNSNVNYSDVLLLNTYIKSDNAGDGIIMYFAKKQLESIWPKKHFDEVPTHGNWVSVQSSKKENLKIVCGTNALSTNVLLDSPIAFPKDVSLYRNSLVLMAAGTRCANGRSDFSTLSAECLKYSLAQNIMHSVRDEKTKERLRKIGITNVINTACVTMWNLTQDFCAQIPLEKAQDVLTTVTDYKPDVNADRFMIDTLKKRYRKVYLWLQGESDYRYIQKFINYDGIEFIHNGFLGLQEFIEQRNGKDLDFIGTRLHCGIYCLNKGIRSLIISVDNRASDIEKDTNLPVLQRSMLAENLVKAIDRKRNTEIIIPEKNIRYWKEQFADIACM